MRRVPVAVFLALALAACSGAKAPGDGDGGLCGGPCGAGMGCDPASHACAPASGLSTPCGADAAAGQPTLCIDGLACGVVTDGRHVCVKPCAGASDCANGQTCFKVQLSSGETDQYCGTPAALGEPCSPEGLRECRSSGGGQIIACIASPDAGAGACMQLCDPTVTCPSGQTCSTPFSNGGGVCIAPTHPGDACNQDQLHFCQHDQVCVVEQGLDGRCHTACDPGDAGCGAGEACVHANSCDTSTAAFCVTPEADGGDCTASQDHFCGPGQDCVNAGTLHCAPDCTGSQSCGGGLACQPVLDGCHYACF